MKGFYEVYRENINELSVNKNSDHSYPSHYHANLEVLLVKSGEYSVTVNGVTQTVNESTFSITDSYDIHSYELLSEGEGIVVIIPYKYLLGFNAIKGEKVLKSNFITDKTLANRLYNFAYEYLAPGEELYVQGVINAFIGMLIPSLSWQVGGKGKSVFAIKTILSYVYANYQTDLTREKIANALGYNETYLSKVFKSFTGEKISSYINGLRYNYVVSKLKEGSQKTLTELIYEAGFQSRQTYFRAKKQFEKVVK